MSGSSDKLIKIWNYKTGECICSLEGHDSDVNSVTCIPETKFIVSGSKDETIMVWNYETGELI